MAIDTIAKLGGAAAPAPASAPAPAAASDSRQKLPLSGQVLPAESAASPGQPPQAAVTQAVRHLSDYVQTLRRDLQFSVDEASGRTVIRVMDAETGEVIRQIPPEEILAIAQRLEEVSGVIFKGRA